jgi:hypothetical protein
MASGVTRPRVMKAVQLHLANHATYFWVPLAVVGGTFLISLAMYGVLRLGLGADAPPAMYGMGGLQFIPAYYCVTVGIQAMMYTYQFAMAMSLTRREYINGTTVMALLFAGGLSLMFALGRLFENLTGGYGIGFNYFGLTGWFQRYNVLEQWVFLAGLSLLFLTGGFAGTVVYKRGGAIRLVVVMTLWTLLVVGGTAIVTWREWWPAVGTWVLELTPAGAGFWMLLASAGFLAGSYWSMRKTVP